MISYLLLMLVSLLTTAAMTIAVGDLCLQRPPSMARSWRVALNRGFGRLLGTQLLAGFLAGLWALLLIVPGLIAAMRFIFSLSVLALENQAGMQALRRSSELARGKLWRNFGVLLLVFIPIYLAVILFGGLSGVLVYLSGFKIGGEGSADWLPIFIIRVVSSLIVPPFIIAIVLLYYDMRARKEAFDSTALAQELMH